MRLIGINALKTSGLRRLAVVVALAAAVVLALAAMPGCGSDCPTPEQRAYLNVAEDWADRNEAEYGDLEAVLGEVPSRPEALIDEEWRRRLRRVLDGLNLGYEEMMNVEVPAGAEETHRAVVRVAEAAIEANQLLWQGVLDVDAEVLDRSNEKQGEAIGLLGELVTTIERFCE